MIIPRNDNEEFEFYSKFFRNLHLNLSDEKDKRNVILWFNKLRNDEDSSIKVKKEYLKLLLFLLQRKKLISPFTKAPKQDPLPENLDQLNIKMIAKKLCDDNKTTKKEKKLVCSVNESGDSRAIFQHIPKWGIHGFITFDKKVQRKSNDTISNPFKMLLEPPKTKKLDRTVTFADKKGFDRPYTPRSRHGQGIISSTTFLKNKTSITISSKTEESEEEIQCEKLNSALSASKSKKISNSKTSLRNNNNNGSILEQLYYSSQYDTTSKNSNFVIEEIFDTNDDETENRRVIDEINSLTSMQRKSRNYYSLNDLQNIKYVSKIFNEHKKMLMDKKKSSKASKKEIKVSNKKTFVIKKDPPIQTNNQTTDLVKRTLPISNVKSFNVDENQYYERVDFNFKENSSVPTTWVRCKSNSEHSSYVMRTYPTESNSTVLKSICKSGRSETKTEIEELLNLLDSIKEDIKSKNADDDSKNSCN